MMVGGTSLKWQGGIPLPFLGELFRFNINSTVNSGDNTPITGATDLSGQGNIITGGAAGQEMIYAENRYGSGQAGALSSDQWLKVAPGNPMITFFNGKPAATTPFSFVINMQQRVHITSTWVSFYNSALLSRHFSIRTVTSTYVPQVIGGTSTGAQASISAPGTSTLFNRWHPCPMLYIFRTDGAFDYHRIDGTDDTPVARNWTGNYSCDTFAIGAGSTGGAFTRLNNGIYPEVIFYGHKLTDTECQEIEAYTGSNYGVQGWKQKLGGTRPTKIFAMPGQSNNAGGCPATQSYTSQPGAFEIALDGLYKPLTEPSHATTNQVTTPLNWNPALIGASKMLAFCTRLAASGETKDMLVVTGALPGSTADSWVQNITDPPNMLNLSGRMKMIVNEALKAPDPELVWLIDQGEADCDTMLEATSWLPKWESFRAEMNTYYAGFYSLTKLTRYIVSILSNPIAGTGIFTTDLRTSQTTFAANWADVVAYQRPQGSCEAPVGLHLTDIEQVANGELEADFYVVSP